MSDDEEREDGLTMIDPDDMPDLTTDAGRAVWAKVFMAQDDETLSAADRSWVKALVVHDGLNMVVRFMYEDGTSEAFDVKVRGHYVVDDDPKPEEGSN